MIEFYEDPIPETYSVYQAYTQGKSWNDPGYSVGLPKNFASSNTKTGIKAVLQAPASKFAFGLNKEDPGRVAFEAAVTGEGGEKLIVLKGLHQYKEDIAHLTAAWMTTLWHFNIKVNGLAQLSVQSVELDRNAVISSAEILQ